MLVDFPILTLIVFLPALGALLSYVAASARAARWIALGFSLAVLGLASLLLVGFLWTDAVTLPKMVTPGAHTYYAAERSPWVPTLNVNYFLGADELSVVLIFLNALLTPLALAISWDEKTRVPEFFAMFLFMEMTISGVFLSLDLFQFLVFWEFGLVPMYFLIAVWGGPRRSYAAFKFFLYTFLASLPLLVVIFAFYLYSSPHTFDMTVIISTLPIPPGPLADLAFVGLLIAFGTKLPTWPLHTWLPDAHVEAPTGGSVILAGVLLKLGGDGLIPVNIQMIPRGAPGLLWGLAAAGLIFHPLRAPLCLAPDDLQRVRRGVQRVHRRLRGLRPPRLRADPHGHPDGGILHLGDATRDLRAAESEMGDDARPARVRGRAPRRPRRVVRGVRHPADPGPGPHLQLGARDSGGPPTCLAMGCSSRRRFSWRPRSRPRSSASRGGSGPRRSGRCPRSERASRSS